MKHLKENNTNTDKYREWLEKEKNIGSVPKVTPPLVVPVSDETYITIFDNESTDSINISEDDKYTLVDMELVFFDGNKWTYEWCGLLEEYFVLNQILTDTQGRFINRNDSVLVPEPTPSDEWNYDFSGTVTGFKEEYVLVEDMEENTFMVKADRLEIE